MISLALDVAAISTNRHLTTSSSLSHAETSTTLVWCLLSILLIGIVAQLILFVLVIKNRESSTIKASQPAGLLLIAAGGATALAGGCCLIIIPPTTITCAIAEQIIFISVTLIGASLTGMAWRVERIVSPILRFGRRRASTELEGGINNKKSIFGRAKEKNMEVLTALADISFRKRRVTTGSSRNLCQAITNRCLIQLIVWLTLPQLVFQILTISLAQLRRYTLDNMCTRPSGTWWTALAGTILTTYPFVSLFIVTFKQEGETAIPSVLCLADSTKKILAFLSFASVTIAPLLAFDSIDTNMAAYISIYLLLAAVIPSSYFVLWSKLYPILFPKSDRIIDVADQLRSCMGRLDNKRHERALEALDQGQLFDELGMPNKSIKVYNDALDMWQRPNEMRQFVGDFSTHEIQSFGAGDAELIAMLLIAKAVHSEKHYVLKAAECHLKAIEIFEFAPLMASVKDRSIIFPCFHSLFRFLREGKLERDVGFEKGLAARFVQESIRSNCFHHACALALNAEMKARSGLPREALKEFDSMISIYSTANSRAIKEISGSIDICALAWSRSVLWYMELGDEENAMKQYEIVIKMLGDLNSSDAGEMHALLTPIINISRVKGEVQRLGAIYEHYVLQHVQESAMPFYMRNMLLVLRLCEGTVRCKVTDADIAWVLSDENIKIPSDFDVFYISLGMSLNTLAAEALYLVAQRRDRINVRAVIDKGLYLATVASRSTRENNNFICPMAHEKNETILSQLQLVAESIGLDPGQGRNMKRPSIIEVYDSISTRRKKAALQLRAKTTLPHELLIQHDTAAFIGLTHDSLAKVFNKALAEDPNRRWERIYVCYVADPLLEAFVSADEEEAKANEIEDLRRKIAVSKQELHTLLEDRADDLCFYEVNHHCFFGSWFGWREPGGKIHVSPSIWGVGVKQCPGKGYTWEPDDTSPDDEYKAYRHGIENILDAESPFATILDVGNADQIAIQEDLVHDESKTQKTQLLLRLGLGHST